MTKETAIKEISGFSYKGKDYAFSDPSSLQMSYPSPEGIYFGMSAKDYFALPYFSRSAAQIVRFSGKQFEHSLKNPVEETPAMALGTAIHSMFLEPEDFSKTYVKAPSFTTTEFGKKFEGKKVLETTDDLKPFLETFGLKKSGLKAELVDNLRDYLNPSEVVIWDDVENNFYPSMLDEKGKKVLNRTKTKDGRKILSDDDFKTLTEMRAALPSYQDLPKTLENGRAEVVIIWKDKETGIMCKCRLDYVQPLAVTDVKSYSVKDFFTPLLDQLRKKTVWSFYNFQYAIYKEALETVITEINARRAQVHGESDQEWLKEFLKNPVKQFFILYVRTQAPYQMQGLELEPAEIHDAGHNTYFAVAKDIWRSSIRKYAHWQKTGEWLGENEIEVLRDEHVPNVMWQQSLED